MIAPNVIIIWPGTHAGIPAGFSRVTELDDKFPKASANATDPGDTGGADTHTHTSPTHSHTVASHTHTGTSDSRTHHTSGSGEGSDATGGATRAGNHTHSFSIGSPSGSASSVAVTYAAYSSFPPYYEVIYIKATTYKQVPVDGVVLWSDSSDPSNTNFKKCDGNNGTPDFTDKYLKGAATAGNAGATGGSLTNTHTITHTHTDTHTHSGGTGGPIGGDGSTYQTASDSPFVADTNHTHGVTLAGASNTSDNNSSIGSQAETVEPAYKKLMAYQNKAASGQTPKAGMIAMFLGDIDEIPVGWVLCDGGNGTPDMRSKHLKITNTAAHIGNTGGSNTHTHANQSHTHTAPSHSHATAFGWAAEQHGRKTQGHANWGGEHSSDQPNHPNMTSSATTYSYDADNTSADSADNQPSFLTVLYVMFKFMRTGGGFIGLL